MPAVAAEMPVKPNTPATIEMMKKMIAHLSIGAGLSVLTGPCRGVTRIGVLGSPRHPWKHLGRRAVRSLGTESVHGRSNNQRPLIVVLDS